MPIFVVHARGTPEALSRIVLLFHRRRAAIHSLLAEYDRKSDALRVEVRIDEEDSKSDLIEANLYKLWDVMLVERRNSDQPMAPRRKRGVVREP